MIKEKSLNSESFRAGVIYSIYSQYPTVYSTVDIAIFNEDKTEILLGRKADESQLRFIGGFVDPEDQSDEMAARREVFEETCLECHSYKFELSSTIDDWRYRGLPDK